MTNHYETLGVDEDASLKDIKKAYRKLVKELHPDRNPNGESRMKDVNAAFDVLGDEHKRLEYDSQRQYDNGIFGNRFTNWQTNNEPTRNNVHSATGIPLDVFIHGGTVTATLNVPEQTSHTPFGIMGLSYKTVEIDLNIEPNTPVGSKVYLMPHEHNIDSVNELVIQLLPAQGNRRQYIVDNYDVHVFTEINVFDAMFGKEITIDLPTREAIKVTIPKNTKNGKRLRIAGKGMVMNAHNRGDAYIVVNYVVPELSDEKLSKIQSILQEDTS